jgi:Sigma-70 region 2
MDLHSDLQGLVCDAAVRRVALRRAGSRELAEDALQETYWHVVHADLGNVGDLRAYFVRALVREIDHLRRRAGAVLVADVTSAVEQGATSGSRNPPDSVERQAAMRQLGETVLERLNSDREELMAAVPGRSLDQQLYRTGIVIAAGTIFLLLLQGTVARTDENQVLRSVYPQWFADPGLTAAGRDQRLSRGRRDVRGVQQRLVTRDELC